DAPVFKAVGGRHMIFRIRKRCAAGTETSDARRNENAACRVVTTPVHLPHGRMRNSPEAHHRAEYYLSHEELVQNGRLVVFPSDPSQHIYKNRGALGEL